jgi:hypothetical protein
MLFDSTAQKVEQAVRRLGLLGIGMGVTVGHMISDMISHNSPH